MNDSQIDQLLRATKIEASADFTTKTLACIKAQSLKEKSLDDFCDKLLLSQKQKASDDFSEKAIRTIKREKSASTLRRIIEITMSASVAACIAISVFALPIPQQTSLSEEAFAEVANLNTEISNLAVLIYEQELSSY